MKKLYAIGLIVLFGWAVTTTAQVPANDEAAPLVLVRIIPMPDFQGRFDHMGVSTVDLLNSRWIERLKCSA